MNIYIGTYTHNNSEGIYKLNLDENINDSVAELVAVQESPSYFYLSTDKKRLYAVSETTAGKNGEVCAYQLEHDKLQLINKVIAPCGGLVHLTLDKEEHFLFAVSYSDAAVLMYRLDKDGSISELCSDIRHSGSGFNPIRQDKAYAHSVYLTPDEKFLCVCDLGIDMIAIYEVNYHDGKLIKREDLNVELPPGCGPRHMEFHPNGKYAYVLTELSSEIFILEYDMDAGFNILQWESSLMHSKIQSFAAAIRITKDGKFLYTSNRGEDSISIFKMNEDGTINLRYIVSSNGKHPRDFILCSNDQYILCANKDSDNITKYSRDSITGMLSFVEEIKGINMPVCLLAEE